MSLKPPKTFEEQLAILEERGLLVPDRAKALRALQHANYFRLSCYHAPFLNPDEKTFRANVTFDAVWDIYRFDHRLRILLLDAIERCEVSFRTRWAYEIAHRHGPQAYENEALHKVASRHQEALLKTDEEIERSREHFLAPYRGKETPRPPVWIVSEVMSLGQISTFYGNLRSPADRQAIADAYEFDEKLLGSFLHHLTVVRNLCAHHSRCWNRLFSVKLQLPRKKPAALLASLHPAEPQRIYNTLIVLIWFLEVMEPQNQWALRVKKLIEEQAFPVANHMGFPLDWKERPFWRLSSGNI